MDTWAPGHLGTGQGGSSPGPRKDHAARTWFSAPRCVSLLHHRLASPLPSAAPFCLGKPRASCSLYRLGCYQQLHLGHWPGRPLLTQRAAWRREKRPQPHCLCAHTLLLRGLGRTVYRLYTTRSYRFFETLLSKTQWEEGRGGQESNGCVRLRKRNGQLSFTRPNAWLRSAPFATASRRDGSNEWKHSACALTSVKKEAEEKGTGMPAALLHTSNHPGPPH